MAELSTGDRTAIHERVMREASAERAALTLTKADLRAAVDAVDGWIDANAASFNAALPQPARSALTARQKAQLFLAVARRRWEVS